ncbi:MAG: hypothetical protein CMM46_11595 [Rhodospirillaceae bacterium]|nr:hypothetical protein [Rhodospirillaceae bacterium]|tara:strand:+ start:3808 stop:4023 length:216 start_codon:yes stop_codon:yes gene_type:complete
MAIWAKDLEVDHEIKMFEMAPADEPYFPLWGFASPVERHVTMLALVDRMAQQKGHGSQPMTVLGIGASMLT